MRLLFFYNFLFFLFLSSQLHGVNCVERPPYQHYEAGVQLTTWEGVVESLYNNNGQLCSAGVYLEDCESKTLTFNVKFPFKTNRKKIKYYVELWEASSTNSLTGLTNYELIAESPETSIDDHYHQNTLYPLQIVSTVKPNHTYRVRLRYKSKAFGVWELWWNNKLSNTWNVYPTQEATFGTCPFGSFNTKDCLVMIKPDGGFIFNNCFYVLAKKGTGCPEGTSYDGANCYLMDIPNNGFIYKNNFYVQPSNGNCPIGNYDGANCRVFKTPWGHHAFEYRGKWYVTPKPICPDGFSYDGANCKYKCAPCGRTAFEYNGKWYYTYDD